MEKWKAPKVVSVSEDATRMIGKVCHDTHTNNLLGFSSPLDKNGMPILDSFPARNVAEMQKHFNGISTMAYTLMAQPLAQNVPPFVLTLFSTDNKFKAADVLNRFTFVKQELTRNGIQQYTHVSDCDARLLRAMKITTGIGMPTPEDSEDNTSDENSEDNTSDFKCKYFSWKPIITIRKSSVRCIFKTLSHNRKVGLSLVKTVIDASFGQWNYIKNASGTFNQPHF